METSKFLKVGKSVNFKIATDGLEYSLEPGKVYSINIDRYNGTTSLEDNGMFDMPDKIYSTEKDDKFVAKVLKHYNESGLGFTGVMLTGTKGSGKTITAKRIAMESGLPIINIGRNIGPAYISKIVKLLGDTSVCFFFDELDKVLEDYDDSALLQILDGSDTKGKHLILFTCNDDSDLSEYLIDRCSRIRYWREFDEISTSMIDAILEDVLEDKKEKKSLIDFINENFSVKSFDNIISFAKEVNAFPTDTFEELFEDMNLTSK